MKRNSSSEPVKLRMRTLPDGRQSLYLDIYYPGGSRQYEYLRLYLVPDTGKEAREANRDTLRLAEAVRARRCVEYQEGRLGIVGGEAAGDADFIAFFRELARKRGKVWEGCLWHLLDYTGRRPVPMRSVNGRWLEGVKRYLMEEAASRREYGEPEPLSVNSAYLYFCKVRAAVNEAVRRHLITGNPCSEVRNIQTEEVERPYLTLDELRRLAATPCRNEALRRAFLFSCLTGLRKSDIVALRWADIREEGGYTRIVFRQRKTRGQEYLDISPEAVRYLGERGAGSVRPFADFKYSVQSNHQLRRWAKMAGIGKDISFHTGRHTFAVVLLQLGTDIYTLQKLLGHRNIGTTQIYAKMLDEGKREAVARIPSIEGIEAQD